MPILVYMGKGVVYVCSNCGYTTSKWYGKCPSCHEWGTFVEKTQKERRKEKSSKLSSPVKPVRIEDAPTQEIRFSVDRQFDEFLGGGLVKGGVYLFSGFPGVGKSTILLQIAQKLSKNGVKVIYISSEESVAQVSLRASRLGVKDIYLLSHDDIDAIVEMTEMEKPQCVILDSIHTVHSDELDSLVGGIQQVRYAAERIVEAAKSNDITAIIVAHVTKEGSIAGPRMLEHMVDAVVFMDGDEDIRILKLNKNRYGPTDESLIMEMSNEGLRVVLDPTVRFVQQKQSTDGMVYGMTVEGRYPIAVEVQALCVQTPLAIPRRVCVGFDINRLHMILAVLEKKLNLPMFKYDVYLNMAGGIRVSTTLVDMAVVGSIVSSFRKRAFGERTVMVGELDLSGSFRLPKKYEKHLKKIASCGFNVLSPLSGYGNVKDIISSL